MNFSCLRFRFPVVLWVLAFLAGPVAAKSDPEAERKEIRAMRDSVLAELYRMKPSTKAMISKAAGYAVFTNVGVNVFFASFAGGKGIVVEDGSLKGTETFMKMASAGVGLGLGVKDFRAVFVFHDREKLRAFVENGWDFSGQADAAAKSDDKGAALAGAQTIVQGVDVYQITKNGIALQATLQGTKYWKDKKLN